MKRLKYCLACWLLGYDVLGAIEVARLQGHRTGTARAYETIMAGLNGSQKS